MRLRGAVHLVGLTVVLWLDGDGHSAWGRLTALVLVASRAPCVTQCSVQTCAVTKALACLLVGCRLGCLFTLTDCVTVTVTVTSGAGDREGGHSLLSSAGLWAAAWRACWCGQGTGTLVVTWNFGYVWVRICTSVPVASVIVDRHHQHGLDVLSLHLSKRRGRRTLRHMRRACAPCR